MKNENQDEDKHKKKDSLTLEKLVCTWYIGAIVGFALGNLKGDITTAVLGAVAGAAVSYIFKRHFMSNK